MRLFIGISIGDAARDALACYAAALATKSRGVFARRDMYHITLAFLGETPPSALPGLRAALNAVAANRADFELALDKPGYFGGAQRAILYCGVSASPALHNCAADLRRALTAAGYSYDEKPFKAHITLARKVDVGALALGQMPGARFPARGLTLYHSDRVDGALTYTPIHFAAFGGKA